MNQYDLQLPEQEIPLMKNGVFTGETITVEELFWYFQRRFENTSLTAHRLNNMVTVMKDLAARLS